MLWHGGQHFVIRSPNSLPSALLPQTLTTTQARSAGPLEVTNSDPFTSSHLPRRHTCFLTPSLCSLAFFITIPSLPLIQDSFLILSPPLCRLILKPSLGFPRHQGQELQQRAHGCCMYGPFSLHAGGLPREGDPETTGTLRSWGEMQNLGPTPDLLLQNLHFMNKGPW